MEEYLTESVQVGYGKTRRQVKATAENVATDKGVQRGRKISDGWWIQRHPNLSLRRGDATGHIRMNAMTKENLTNYFDLLRDCLTENGLMDHPERIYNMDESGIPLDPKLQLRNRLSQQESHDRELTRAVLFVTVQLPHHVSLVHMMLMTV